MINTKIMTVYNLLMDAVCSPESKVIIIFSLVLCIHLIFGFDHISLVKVSDVWTTGPSQLCTGFTLYVHQGREEGNGVTWATHSD